MTTFAVWAPEKAVKLRISGADHDMEQADDGWWRLDETAPRAKGR